MQYYNGRLEAFAKELSHYKSQSNTISTARLILAALILIFGYYILDTRGGSLYVSLTLACVALFIILMKVHTNVARKRERAQALVTINTNETAYLNNRVPAFADGAAFVNHKHPYTHDLDIFGPRSLYHNINRTQTYRGGYRLAVMLNKTLSHDEILQNQQAIKELSQLTDFRQEVMALGMIKKDSRAIYNNLLEWIKKPLGSLAKPSVIIATVSPIALIVCWVIAYITGNPVYTNATVSLTILNLSFILSYLKFIKKETNETTAIHQTISNYGLIIDQIEKAEFTSPKLKALQQQLKSGGSGAGKQLRKLAGLLSQMDSVGNIVGAALLNGFLLYHFHILRWLLQWKEQHSANVEQWLEVIAEIEALSSMANLYYNNADFVFPELTNDYTIDFKNLSHPLIRKEVRIGNDVTFNPQFTILTGSNMSGKSTFLRSLGINMVLAGCGSAVCAAHAKVHPLPVLVSMRLSDSLSDSESYFFAEIKRLREVMDILQNQRAFVLLDEILRGTNSDDKRTGTIKVVEKMVAFNAIGAIATHDVEVCDTANLYPDRLINRCFEAQIIDNELFFDYRLRDGICKNKSATFLMEKMGVI